MKEIFVGFFVVIVVVVVLSFGGLFYRQFFGVREANVERVIFEQSQSFNEGMIRDLENMKMQYDSCKSLECQDAMRAIILHRFSSYPVERLPAHLAVFYSKLQGN